MNAEAEHAGTREQMATALTDGLTGDDRARFDAHLAACASCATEFAELRAREADLVALFADARPAPGFEDRLIRNLRQTKPRRTWVHPMVRHAATGVAAALVLASAGYVVTSASNGGTLPDLVAVANRVKSASSLKDLGDAVMLSSTENRGGRDPQSVYFDDFTAPSSNADWDVAATTQPAAGRQLRGTAKYHWYYGEPQSGTRNLRELAQNQSHGYQRPYPDSTALGSGFKLNGGLSGGFAVGGDVNSGAGESEVARRLGGKSVGKEDDKKVPYDEVLRHPTNSPDKPAVRFDAEAKPGQAAKSVDHDMDDKRAGARAYFQGGQVQAGDGIAAVPSVNGRGDQSNRFSLGLTAQPLEEGKAVAADSRSAGSGTPLTAFKPADLAALTPAEGAKPSNGGTIDELHQKLGDAKEVALQAGVQGGQQQGKPPDAPTAGSVIVGDLVQPVPPQVAQAGQEQPAPAPQTPQPPPQAQQPPQAAPSRKVIRTGVMEFEVDRFDAALAMITKLTQENGGYIGTTDSEKLPNGKVKGTVTVRVPPDRLDTLVMQLRGIGDLRSQKMDAQDVTKQYTDLEGELRAARAMEERLLEIIKTGKGEIKDLLAAEKELGVWRTKIEKMVGEMRYYDNLVSLTTLTITAFERDIRTAATSKETETVQAGIETDDVETARAAALKAIDDAKGRVIQSDLKRHDAGQFSAQVVADVAPDAAGPLVDRLKQLGKVARFEVQRKQTTPEGTTQPAPGARLERADTRINLSLYNLANVAPRQTTNLNLAAADVESAYKAIAARVEKAGGRVVTSNLSRPQADQVVGSISFEVKAADAEPVLGDVRTLGEVMRLTVTENPDTNNVTTAKQGFVVQLASVAAVPARESTNLQIAAADVPTAYNALRDAVRATPARVTTSQLNEAVRENVTAIIDFEVMRADLAAVEEVLKKLGDVTQRTSGRSGDTENTVDSKVRMQVSFVDADQLPPRETTALGIETSDPDKALADLQSFATGAGGRVIQSDLSQERGGQTIGKLVVDVPLAKSVELITRAKGQGSVRMVQSTKDAQVPDGSLARARVDMTFATSERLVASDQGVWASIRRGLATSMTGLMWSLQLIVIGLCFVGPWVLLILLGWKILRRKKAAPAAVPA